MSAGKKMVLFYDGECALCSWAVQFVLNNEKDQLIQFAALQDERTVDFFLQHDLPKIDISTIYFYRNGVLSDKSTAALNITRYLKYPARFLFLGFVFPKFFRDWIYTIISRNRKSLVKNHCSFSPQFYKRNFFNCDAS